MLLFIEYYKVNEQNFHPNQFVKMLLFHRGTSGVISDKEKINRTR